MVVMQILVEKGSIITCPQCGERIAKTTKNLYKYSALLAEDFEGIQQPLYEGMRTQCKKCGAEWFLAGSLHLDRGWAP